MRALSKNLAARAVSLLLLAGPVYAQSSNVIDNAGYEPTVREVTIEPAVFEDHEGGRVEGERGVMRVPEVRGDPDSQMIDIAFLRIKTTAEQPAPPVVLLHGGPSETGIIESRSSRIHVLTEMQSVADYILVDGRGLGLSAPKLNCPIEDPVFVIDFSTMKKMYAEEGAACAQYWRNRGVDLRGYNPIAFADDVADLMESLGYQQYSATGNSFGAYWGMALARRYPEKIYRIAISGLLGPDETYSLPSDAEAAFTDLLQHLDKTEASRVMFDDKGVTGAYKRVMARLDKKPVEVEVSIFGRTEIVRFDTITLSRMIYFAGMSMHREGAVSLPMFLYALDKKAYKGVAKSIAREFEQKVAKNPLNYNLSSVSTICNEVNSPAYLARHAGEVAQPASDFWMGQVMKSRNAAYACGDVDFPLIDNGWAAPFESATPVFAMMGSFDGNTPPRGAMRALENFPNHRAVVVNAGGHRHREIESLWPALGDYRRRFLAGDDLADLPAAVELPPFEVEPIPWYGRLLFNIGLGNVVIDLIAS